MGSKSQGHGPSFKIFPKATDVLKEQDYSFNLSNLAFGSSYHLLTMSIIEALTHISPFAASSEDLRQTVNTKVHNAKLTF